MELDLGDIPIVMEMAGIDPSSGYQFVAAEQMALQHHAAVNVSWPLIIGHFRDRGVAASVKRTLETAYPVQHRVIVLHGEGDDARQDWVRLSELAQASRFDTSIHLIVPPLEPGSSFTDLQETIAHLRAPEGCPWDREQTLASLRPDLLSECVEAMEAIDLDEVNGDNGAHIAEELGDVLLLVTMMVQIAIDDGRFRMADVMHHIVSKLIRRHPHVFGETSVAGAGEVSANWDAIKAEEKAAKGMAVASPLDGVPVHLPALEKARSLQSKASKAGLLDRHALAHSIPELGALLGPEADERKVGELLWTLTALAREYGVNAEDALRQYSLAYRHQIESDSEST